MWKLKNTYLLGLGMWLNSLSLAGKESRQRTRFVKIIADRVDELKKFREDIIGKYTEEKMELEKEKDGSDKEVPKIVNDNYVFKNPEFLKEFNKELEELYDEELVLDKNEGNKSKVDVVSDIVLNTGYKFGWDDEKREKISEDIEDEISGIVGRKEDGKQKKDDPDLSSDGKIETYKGERLDMEKLKAMRLASEYDFWAESFEMVDRSKK